MRNDIQNIEDQKIKSKGSRPIIFLTVVFVLTWVALIWFGWNAWSSYHTTKTDREYSSKIEKLRRTIIHLDEVLTMSARMAAATGNLGWEERYRSFEPKLDAAIKEAMRLAPEAYSGKAATDTDTANIILVEMENHSFDLVRQGQFDEAKALLFSDKYEEQKRIYAQGMTNFAAGLSITASTSIKDKQRQAFLRVGSVFLLILLLIIVLFVTLRVVRSWEETLISKQELEKEIAERKQAEEALTKSETFLNATGQIAKVGGWEIDGKTKKVFWTKEIYNINEVPDDYDPSSLEKEAISFFNTEDQLRLEKAIQRAFEHNKPYDMEFQITTAKGNKKWVQAICEPIVVGGKVVKLGGTFQDINERKQSEEALRRERDKLEDALAKVKTLSGMLPICSHCKSVRDDKGYWSKIESYIGKHSEAKFSHGVCPECADKFYPEYDLYGEEDDV